MKRQPRSRPSPPAAVPADQAVDLTSTGAPTAPQLPHERDQSAGMTGGEPSARVQQGQRDLKRGLQDTSRAPEADTAYRQLKKK